jgi:seryl-tRNA synthetase
MLDVKAFRQDVSLMQRQLAKRHFELDVATYTQYETQRKALQVESEQLKNERNVKSKKIGELLGRGEKEQAEAIKKEVSAFSERSAAIDAELATLAEKLDQFFLNIPNIPDDSVPIGQSESENLEVRRYGVIPEIANPKDHIDIAERLGGCDIDAASRLSGSRFAVLKGQVAKLHRALIQFMLDMHTQHHGYEEVAVPFLVRAEMLKGTGQLPKFEADLFKLAGERELYLIPTAEVPVTNLVHDCILEESALPLKYVCHTPCFRSEAGAYGKDTRGLIRQHQFEKVELVQVVKAEDSYAALESLTAHAETILQKLNLPYRVVSLCTGDLGFSSAKTYDLEVWLPSQGTYREISSCSNFEAFQARRMQARVKIKQTQKTELVHTINGSALAVGRTLVAILENGQRDNDEVFIPEVLQPYMGQSVLKPK